MHRLVQAVTRQRLDQDQQQRATVALRLLRGAFPAEHINPDRWPTYARLLPHARAASDHAQALGVETEQAAWLLNQAGLYLWQRADHQQARALFERALTIYETRLGADHPDTMQSRQDLAAVAARLDEQQ